MIEGFGKWNFRQYSDAYYTVEFEDEVDKLIDRLVFTCARWKKEVDFVKEEGVWVLRIPGDEIDTVMRTTYNVTVVFTDGTDDCTENLRFDIDSKDNPIADEVT